MGVIFNEFVAANSGAIKGKIARKFNYNAKSIKLNAEKYVNAERDLVTQYAEQRDKKAVFWNGEDIENRYEEVEVPENLVESPSEVSPPKLIAGLVTIHDGYFFNEKEEILQSPSKLRPYVKDADKRKEFEDQLTNLTKTDVEISLHVFSDEDLSELIIPTVSHENFPVFGTEYLSKFYKYFGNEDEIV